MKIKKFNESINDGKYADYKVTVTIPSFSVDVYLPELYGKALLDYGGPNNDEVKKDILQLIKDNLSVIKGLDSNISNQDTSKEYKWYLNKFETGEDRKIKLKDSINKYNL